MGGSKRGVTLYLEVEDVMNLSSVLELVARMGYSVAGVNASSYKDVRGGYALVNLTPNSVQQKADCEELTTLISSLKGVKQVKTLTLNIPPGNGQALGVMMRECREAFGETGNIFTFHMGHVAGLFLARRRIEKTRDEEVLEGVFSL